MISSVTRALSILSLVFLCSCYTVNLRETGGPPTQMGPSSNTVVGHFDETNHAHFLIYGLINVGTPDVGQVLQEQVTREGGTSIANLQVTTTHTFVDGLINGITLGIYNPVSVELAGDVIK